MEYQFPHNMSLDEVRSVITSHNERLGVKAFIEADRGNHVIFNYLVAFAESFPTPNTGDAELDRQYAILRECRGLTFDKETGRVANRKFAKFFNINEKPETQSSLIDWSRPHVIFEKLDGSMITPLHLGNMEDIGPETLRWCTKMGMTDVAKPVEEWVHSNEHYARWAANAMYAGFTPIFEWCSRQQRIVIDYPEDRLVLTAIRSNQTGEYLSYEEMLKVQNHGVEVVRALDGNIQNIEQFMAETRDLEGAEGYVVRFDNGHMVKIKAEQYILHHKTKDSISLEKNIVSMIINSQLDDAKQFMIDSDRARVEEFENKFFIGISNSVEKYEAIFQEMLKICDDKRDFAINQMPNLKNNPFVISFIFARYSNREPRDLIIDEIKKNCSSQSKIDSVRHLWGEIRWQEQQFLDL